MLNIKIKKKIDKFYIFIFVLEDFYKNLRDLIIKIVLDNMNIWKIYFISI